MTEARPISEGQFVGCKSAKVELKDYSVSLTADELPPGSSVLAQVNTDEEGRFEITEIPTTQPYQFVVRKPHDQLKPPWNDSWASGPITFVEPGIYDWATSFMSENVNLKQIKVKTLNLKLVGLGVHSKTAIRLAKEKSWIKQKEGSGLSADEVILRTQVIKLANDGHMEPAPYLP